jgi:hypothetical protein
MKTLLAIVASHLLWSRVTDRAQTIERRAATILAFFRVNLNRGGSPIRRSVVA